MSTTYNKVTANGQTLIDLSQDTVSSASHIRSGYIGHLNDGTQVTGNYTGGGDSDWTTLVDQTVSISSGSPNYFTISNYTTAIGLGEQYRVTWGESTHVYISREDGRETTYDGYYFGNDAVIGNAGDNSGLALLLYRSSATTLAGVTTDTGSKYLKIEKNIRSLNFQTKTNISPTTSSQTIKSDNGYDALHSVQINAMPSGSATGPSSLTASSATVSTGTNTLTLTKTGVTTTPTVSAGYVASATASTATVALTASVTTKAATTYHPSTSNQTIASGTYTTGTQTINAVTTTNLSASNILNGVTIKVGDSSDDDCVASVTGNVTFVTIYTGSGTPSNSTGSNGDIYIQS